MAQERTFCYRVVGMRKMMEDAGDDGARRTPAQCRHGAPRAGGEGRGAHRLQAHTAVVEKARVRDGLGLHPGTCVGVKISAGIRVYVPSFTAAGTTGFGQQPTALHRVGVMLLLFARL